MNPDGHGVASSDDDGDSVSTERLGDEEDADGRNAERSDSAVPSDEGEGDDLLQDNFLQDYQPNPELDHYEADGMVVDDVTEQLTAEEQVLARRRAEEEMDARDRVHFRRHAESKSPPERRPVVTLALGIGESVDSGSGEEPRPPRRRRVESLQAADLPVEDDESGEQLMTEFQEAKGSLKEWIQQERVKFEVEALFRRFVHNFKEQPDEQALYEAKIRDLITYTKTSLSVDFMHMATFSQVLYHWTVLQPKLMIEIFNKAVYEMVCERQSNFSLLWSKEVYVRFENIPVEEKLRGLTKDSLEMLVYIRGVVTRRTSVFPQLKEVSYDCMRCGNVLGPFFIHDDKDFKPDRCPNCQSKGPMSVNAQNTVYQNYQKLTLQESPGEVPPGMVPRQKEVILQQVLHRSPHVTHDVTFLVCRTS